MASYHFFISLFIVEKDRRVRLMFQIEKLRSQLLNQEFSVKVSWTCCSACVSLVPKSCNLFVCSRCYVPFVLFLLFFQILKSQAKWTWWHGGTSFLWGSKRSLVGGLLVQVVVCRVFTKLNHGSPFSQTGRVLSCRSQTFSVLIGVLGLLSHYSCINQKFGSVAKRHIIWFLSGYVRKFKKRWGELHGVDLTSKGNNDLGGVGA